MAINLENINPGVQPFFGNSKVPFFNTQFFSRLFSRVLPLITNQLSHSPQVFEKNVNALVLVGVQTGPKLWKILECLFENWNNSEKFVPALSGFWRMNQPGNSHTLIENLAYQY